MTKYFEDIQHQPSELMKIFDTVVSNNNDKIDRAACLLRANTSIYVIGMGASWHAGMAVVSFLNACRRPAILLDASELLMSQWLPDDAAVILLSRSGKSKDIVDLLPLLRLHRAKIITITNDASSPAAAGADVVLALEAKFDTNVSVTMYSGIAMVGCLLAAAIGDQPIHEIRDPLSPALRKVEELIPSWRDQIGKNRWLSEDGPYYFLARGTSIASCHEARLLWEEAAKAGATALSTGGFRHGPQEIVRAPLRIALWLDPNRLRSQDIELAHDLRQFGANVMLIGQEVDDSAADLVIHLPSIPAPWQFLIDIVPMQIAADCLARATGRDSDSFRLCSYVVVGEGGLTVGQKGLKKS
jgi:glucosamine--fructose-6-phosphate aminotransferase (isomerizing)